MNESEAIDSDLEMSSKAIQTEYDIASFDVRDGVVYTSECYDSGRKIVYPAENENESDLEIAIYESRITAFDLYGNKIKECVIDQTVSANNLVASDDGNTFYYTMETNNESSKQELMKYTFGEKEAVSICQINDCVQIQRMVLAENNLFILGICKRELDTSSSDYYDNGEVLISIDLDTLEQNIVMPCGIIDFAPEENDQLLIYAHDNEGFYLSKYNFKETRFSEKEYKDIGRISGLSYAGNSKYCFSTYDGAYVGEYGKNESSSIGYENIVFFGKSVVCDGNYFCAQANEISITDISSILSRRFDAEVRIISAEYMYDKPDVNGIPVSHEIVDYNSFALTVLSQDSNYDICLAGSRQDFAATLRDKGSFYPLNEIDGVSEYIESCFPYLRDAATDSDGSIWMIPVATGVSALMVNEPLCEKLGAKDIMSMNASDFISFVIQLGKDSDNSKYIGEVNPYYYAELLISNYLLTNDSFNTDEFREMAAKVKDDIFGNFDTFNNPSENLQQAYMTGDYSEVAFGFAQILDIHKLYSDADLSVRNVPMPANSQTSIATITFVSVNPNSNNLAAAKDYISRLAKQLLSDKKSVMLQNSPIFETGEYYSQLKSICYNVQARFSFNSEIFLSDYYSYLEGKLTLEEFITEADRKLRAYLNE